MPGTLQTLLNTVFIISLFEFGGSRKNKFLEIQRANSELAYRVEKLRSNNQAQSALKGPQVVFMFRDTSEP